MHLAVKLFFEDNEEFVLGPGRISLLQSVKELGSLRKAADRAGMSYRWAWGRVKKAEEALGVKLFDRPEEHAGGRPMVLSKEALEIIEWFTEVQSEVQKTLKLLEADMPACLRQAPKKTVAPGRPKKRQPLD